MARKSRFISKIADFMQNIGRRQLWIQTHDIPDPDALASAEALRFIASHYGIRAKIVCNGFPHRRDNLALIRECKIPLKSLNDVSIRSASRSVWAYIDCLPDGGNVTQHPLAPGSVYMAIDHHGKAPAHLKDCDDSLIIVDHAIGATATMLARALMGLDLPFPPRLASALSYAIITDTQDFSRGASETDIEVYNSLFPLSNQKIISRLRNVTQPRQYFQTVHNALEKTFTYRHVSWADLGKIQGGETVAEIADFLLSCERITWSLTLGHTTERLILSIRSSQPKARSATIIKKLVRPFGGTAGGHNELAGGFIYLDGSSDVDAIAEFVIRRFVRLTLRLPESSEDPTGTRLVESQ